MATNTNTKRLRVLHQIYDALPSVLCKGLCWKSCAYINVFPVEQTNLRIGTGKPPPVGAGLGATKMLVQSPYGRCPYLALERCSVYDHRPLICRIFGVAEGLPCPHGCLPARTLPDAEVGELMVRLRGL